MGAARPRRPARARHLGLRAAPPARGHVRVADRGCGRADMAAGTRRSGTRPGARAGRGPGALLGLHRAAAGGHRALAQPRGDGAPGRPRLRLPHGALARGAPEAQRGAARDARPGGTHPRRDAGGSVDPAGALEEAQPPKALARRMTGFRELLERAWEKSDSLVCVGLDPEIERFAAHIAAEPSPIFQFNKAIVDATADLVCAYKPQFAHYAACEAEDQLERTIEYIHKTHPGVPVILDAKRGDVGHTAERYAIEAFLRRADKGVIILCRTSNPGARELQDLVVGGRKLYQVVAELAARRWNSRGNCLLVVGATYPGDLAEVRALVGDMPLLVPGVGAQAGDVAQAVKAGQTPDGTGLIVSSSRAILYASAGGDFATAARKATARPRPGINARRTKRARPRAGP